MVSKKRRRDKAKARKKANAEERKSNAQRENLFNIARQPCPDNSWSPNGIKPCIPCTLCESNRRSHPHYGEYYHDPPILGIDGCGGTNPGACRQGYTALDYRNRWGGGPPGALVCPNPMIRDYLERMRALSPQCGGYYKRAQYSFEPAVLWNYVYLYLIGNPDLQYTFFVAVNAVMDELGESTAPHVRAAAASYKKQKLEKDSSEEDDNELHVYVTPTSEELDKSLIWLGNHTDSIPSIIEKLKKNPSTDMPSDKWTQYTEGFCFILERIYAEPQSALGSNPHAPAGEASRPPTNDSNKRSREWSSPKRVLSRKSRRRSRRKSVRRRSRGKSRRKSRGKSRRKSRGKSRRKSRRKSVKKSRHQIFLEHHPELR